MAEQPNQQEHITIFNNGRVSICDVTELQARIIIWRASREKEEERKAKTTPSSTMQVSESQQECWNSGLSMKRSLQRFLQTRKKRAGSTSPYSQ